MKKGDLFKIKNNWIIYEVTYVDKEYFTFKQAFKEESMITTFNIYAKIKVLNNKNLYKLATEGINSSHHHEIIQQYNLCKHLVINYIIRFMYTEEEVKEMCKKSYLESYKVIPLKFDDWFEDNKKK